MSQATRNIPTKLTSAFLVDRQLLNSGRNIASPIHLGREKAIPGKVNTTPINSDRKEATSSKIIGMKQLHAKTIQVLLIQTEKKQNQQLQKQTIQVPYNQT